ncbi:CSLREA domain-containing protein [Nocardia sp. IFM 10818]
MRNSSLAVLGTVLLSGLFLTTSPAAAEPDPIAATFTVTTTADGRAADPFDGRCRTHTGECTLRAAVQAANARPGSTIVIPPGRYRLTIPPNPLNINGPFIDPTTGDLDLTADTTVIGAGQDETIIDAGHIDRVMLTTARISLADLTITGGNTAQREIPFYDTGGGGIANSGKLRLDRVTVTGNAADYGGGIFNIPVADLTMTDSLVTHNASGEAGGVRCDNTCTFTRTVISDNRVTNPVRWYRPGGFAGRGGGLDIRGIGQVVLIDSLVTRNSATDGGGGINIAPAYLDTLPYQLTDAVNPAMGTLILRGTTITANTSTLGDQNCKTVFAQIISTGGNLSDDSSCDLIATGDTIHPGAGH